MCKLQQEGRGEGGRLGSKCSSRGLAQCLEITVTASCIAEDGKMQGQDAGTRSSDAGDRPAPRLIRVLLTGRVGSRQWCRGGAVEGSNGCRA